MKIYYIGSFPPTYGGVTIKNKNLYEALDGQLDLRKVDMNRIKRGDLRELLRFCRAILTGKQYIIGLAGQKNRRQFTKFMYRFKRKAMERSVLLVMGGIVDDVVEAGPDFLRMFNTYGKTYVELPGMRRKLEQAGVTNSAIYPNGRPRPGKLPAPQVGEGALKCVFFSIIQPEKGVDLILDAARMLPEIQFHFYGELKKDYAKAFLSAVQGKQNISYHGVFSGTAEDVYRELGKYDVLLLPTRWKAEGLPGILVEAKIAGIPAVVSDHNFNREIVTHGVDGLVIPDITADTLSAALRELDGHREKLLHMKRGGREAAEGYYIDVCIQNMITDIQKR